MKYKSALIEMVWQFAYQGVKDGKLILHTGGTSALEEAFEVLGWDDPHYVPDTDGMNCQWPGCPEWATCGKPTPEGYKRYCGKHFAVEEG